MAKLSFELNKKRRQACLLMVSLIGETTLPGASVASKEFPSKPVVFVVPYAPGTAGDQWARIIGPRLSQRWGQPVIVENKPGGGTLIAMQDVVRSTPDGHRLLVGSLSTSMAGLTKANIDFDPQEKLEPVFKFMKFKVAFATNPDTYAKAKTLPDFVALSKKTDAGIFVGDTGPGTAYNMTSGFVLKELGLNYSTIPYNGTSLFTTALMRNDVQVAFNSLSGFKSQFDSKTLYPIAVLSDKRYPELPDVQTVREAGYKGFLPEVWSGIFAPQNTPPAVLDKIANDLLAVSLEPEMKQRLESTFVGEVPNGSRQDFKDTLATETKAWRNFLSEIDFKPN